MLTLISSCILATVAAVREGNCPSITLEETPADVLAKELAEFAQTMGSLTPLTQTLVNAVQQVVDKWPVSLQALSTTLETASEALKEAKDNGKSVDSLAKAMQEASQAKLRELDNEKVQRYYFRKKHIPVLLFNPSQPVPEELIKANIIGKVDKTKYPEGLNAEATGALSLQFKDNGEPDFYPIDQQTFKDQYTERKLARDTEKEEHLINYLETVLKLDIDENDSNFAERRDNLVNDIISKIEYRTKQEPVTMIKVSGLGVSAEQDLTIVPPWDAFAVQKKTENQDAFLVLEKGKYYMVNAENSDSNSNPIAYFPAPQ